MNDNTQNEYDFSYVQLQLRLAIKGLVGNGSTRERLRQANTYDLHKLTEKDFSEALKPKWAAIAVKLDDINSLNEEEASKLAEGIFELYEASLITR